MGNVANKAFNGIGEAFGYSILAPVRAILGRSCDGICQGTWDLSCFIEHFCIASVVRLFMVSVLAFIALYFFYQLLKLGILGCIGKSLCKMSIAACNTYWTAFCFLCHKIKNTKRVHRRRFEDMEEAFTPSDDDDSLDDYDSRREVRRRRSVRERRKEHMRRSLHPTRHSSKGRGSRIEGRHHVRLRTTEVTARVRGSGRIRNSRHLKMRKTTQHHEQPTFKKHRNHSDVY